MTPATWSCATHRSSPLSWEVSHWHHFRGRHRHLYIHRTYTDRYNVQGRRRRVCCCVLEKEPDRFVVRACISDMPTSETPANITTSNTLQQQQQDEKVQLQQSILPITQRSRSTSMESTGSTTSISSTSLAVGTFPISIMSHHPDDAAADDDDTEDHTTMIQIGDSASAHGGSVVEGHEGQHPALYALCVMDCRSERRIVPNANEPFVLDNECFTGTVMLLVRTPDADQPAVTTSASTATTTTTHHHHHHLHLPSIHRRGPDPDLQPVLGETQQRVSQYFRGKKRRFEFQFQIRLKKVPTGALFLGCELERSVKVGGLTKTLVNLLLGMVRRINPGFHYSWGTADDGTGTYEKTHLSFPVEASMDRIVITKPGETLPTLGEELEESAESVKRRRKLGAGSVDWNTENTYTMCLWSAYADWIKWKSFNVPGVSPFSLCRVTGKQPIYLSVYEITSCTSADYKKKRPPHYQKDLKIYTRLEFSNEEKTTGGIAESKQGFRRSNVPSSDQSVPDTDSINSSDFETMSRISHVTT